MIRSSQSLILSMLIATSLSIAADWSVTYSPTQHICALEGSSIIMQCKYFLPPKVRVKEVQWVNQDMEDLSTDPDYEDRVTVACAHRSCSLELTNVSVVDVLQRYYCKITTRNVTETYTGRPGISLSITGLTVVPSKEGILRDGDDVTLTCDTTCSLPGNPSYIWFKDGRLLGGKNGRQLFLGSRRSYSEWGTYTCAVRGFEDIPSTSVEISEQWDSLNDGEPASPVATAAAVILTIFFAGLGFGLRFLGCYYCFARRTPEGSDLETLVP